MIDTLTAEKEEEIAHKDACVDQFNKNSLQTEENTRSKDSLNAKIEDLTQTVAALTKAVATLKQEMADLKGFYEKAALAQIGSTRQPAFKEFKRNENSGGVMNMMNDTNESLDEKNKDLINKSEVLAKTQADLTETTVQRDEVQAQLDQLANELHDIHIDCDFLLKNWDLRVEARDEEVEALKQGLAFFSGASFSSFLQSW